ncbi:hypothetical protein GUJ93_ZPchr0001g31033 [Zizania palustris]|uniref:Homeobox domain-containing protein n=1 Tax=Zizania palustris TaxID=103762 RepID=A0A8J5SH91_ZIZPA|nr:hypothetical protein GUJ93_ZPchr0001g31033 [Zizania palustris]
MASSNRHWPSMFRSKHHAAQPWQTATQPDMGGSPPSLLSGSSAACGGCSLKSPLSSGRCLLPGQGKACVGACYCFERAQGGHERVPDPKPRWNPRPEQIRILEGIFNSGMVNPPRDEIPRIRMQLQEYGQVGDANVFYWFQNRKSRSKNKLRAASGRTAHGARGCIPAAAAAVAPPPEVAVVPFTPPPILPQPVQPQHQLLVSPVPPAPTSSSSSSSDRSSGSSKPVTPVAQMMPVTGAMDLLSPLAAASYQQMLYQGQPRESSPAPPAPLPAPKGHGIVAPDEPIFFPWPQVPCLSAVDLGASILGGQYMHLPVPVQQPPLSPAGTFRGLDVSGPDNTCHRSCAWSAADLGQQFSSGAADQLGLGKSSAASIDGAVSSRANTHDDDATKLGMLQYGFGITTPAGHFDVTSAVAAGALSLVASSPDTAVTVTSAAAATAGLTDFSASTISTGSVVNNQLQELADFGVGVAGATEMTSTATVAAGRGAVGTAVVCVGIDGTAASFVHPAAHFNVRHYFGEAAVLLRYSGDTTEPVRVDESGVTVEPLQQGGVYLVLM